MGIVKQKSLALPEHFCDVLVVGAGAAGLRAAVAAMRAGASVTLVSGEAMGLAHSSLANGMNGSLDDPDTLRRHAYDTVKGSDFLADQDSVIALCGDASDAVKELIDDEIPFRYDLVGHFGTRPYHLPDISGRRIMECSLNILRDARDVKILEEVRVVSLVRGEDAASCAGALAYSLREGSLVLIRSTAAVLATGGYGQIYYPTSTGVSCTGAGVGLALELGAELMDMEMVQYHPTTIPGSGTLISESARNGGAQLLNGLGERFMSRYAPNDLELAPRDLVTRAIRQEISAGRGYASGNVALDFTGIVDIDSVFAHQSTGLEHIASVALEELGIDIRRQPLPVRPAVHYCMGGVSTDANGATSVSGLFAAGEAANPGAHGANRLGGNSLLETIVFGRRAGRAAAAYADAHRRVEPASDEVREAMRFVDGGQEATVDTPSVSVLRRRLGELMNERVGIMRDEMSLVTALEGISGLAAEVDDVSFGPSHGFAAREFRLMLRVAEAVCCSALARRESRGAHQRSDFPTRDDSRAPRHTVVRTQNGKLSVTYRDAVVRDWPVEAREY